MTVYKCDDYDYINKNFGEQLLTGKAQQDEADKIAEAVREVVEHEEAEASK